MRNHTGLALLLCFAFTACSQVNLQPAGMTTSTTIPTMIYNSITCTLSLSPTNTPLQSEAHTLTPTLTPAARRYVFPVQPVEAAIFGQGGHGYPATDIFAPEGVQFVAVTDGSVDFVSFQDRWDPESDDPALRSGLAVAIIGNDGVRYYGSHLSAIADGISPGSLVWAGQTLGWVGKSGNARNTPPHVHFGISAPTYPQDWETRRGQVDPYPYLIAWRGGENLAPQLPMLTPSP